MNRKKGRNRIGSIGLSQTLGKGKIKRLVDIATEPQRTRLKNIIEFNENRGKYSFRGTYKKQNEIYVL